MEVNNTTSIQEHWWFIMRQRASGTVNPEMKKNTIKTYICSPRYFVFFSYYTNAKREYHDHAQADFDFRQVHVIWWLSYCQVEEKIGVEPCDIWLIDCKKYLTTAPWSCFNSLPTSNARFRSTIAQILPDSAKPLTEPMWAQDYWHPSQCNLTKMCTRYAGKNYH